MREVKDKTERWLGEILRLILAHQVGDGGSPGLRACGHNPLTVCEDRTQIRVPGHTDEETVRPSELEEIEIGAGEQDLGSLLVCSGSVVHSAVPMSAEKYIGPVNISSGRESNIKLATNLFPAGAAC